MIAILVTLRNSQNCLRGLISPDSLFTDLLNFDDPLNVTAAQQFALDKAGFERKVTQYIQRHASNCLTGLCLQFIHYTTV